MALTNFNIPSYSQILQSMLNDYRQLSTSFGYNLSIDPGSEIYIRYSGIAGQLSVLYNAASILVNSRLIDTATGTNLDRVANAFGLYRRGATASTGAVALVSATSQTLIAGQALTGPQSLQYQVVSTGVYAAGSNVQIKSVDLGANTNLAVGSFLTWTAAPAGLQTTTFVSVVVTGGVNSEDDDTLRNRLYLQLQSPGQTYNGQGLATLAGSVDNLIQQAFIYGNFNGAGTQLIALTGYQTSSYIGRDIPHLPTDGYVSPYGVLGLAPGLLAQPITNGPYNEFTLGFDNEGGAAGTSNTGNPGPNLSNDNAAVLGQLPVVVANPYATIITTVNNTPSDVSLDLLLPYPVGAPTNGFGGGWQDYIPWPVPDGYYVTINYCPITSVQGNGTVVNGVTGFGITVNAPSSGTFNNTNPNVPAQTYNSHVPVPGATHIQWVNRSDNAGSGWTVVTATVTGALDNGNQTWSIVLDTPLVFADGYDFYNEPGVVSGQYISPAAINAQNYLNTIMLQYALLGPGQTTSSQGLLLLGASRFPGSSGQFPTQLGAHLIKLLETSFPEVYQANYGCNTAANPPPVNSPPNIWVPQNIGWMPSDQILFGL
jgi:hypothetical protein